MRRKASVTAVSTPSGPSGQLSYALELTGILPSKPKQVFQLLTLGSNKGSVFRDIKRESKTILTQNFETGTKDSIVVQEGVLHVFPGQQKAWKTVLQVSEAETVPSGSPASALDKPQFRYSFDLIESDLLSSLNGSWTISDDKQGTKVVLSQNLTPSGIPPFLRHIPFAQRAIKRMLVNTARRQFEDLETHCLAKEKDSIHIPARA